nr:signaling lymphocytic activation molecule isoform X1 [Macaca nemestrina]
MDPKGLLSLTFVLFLSLAFGASYGTGGHMMNCPKILRQLGSKVLLPLTHERINKSMNKSIHIVVTMAKSLENSVENKIVSLDPSEAGPPRYLGDRYKFYLENLTLGIRESRKEDEGWYLMTLEKNVSVQRFCLQLRLYEQVSTPEIKVLNKTQENGTCTLILGCTVEKGDHVAYSWSEKAGTHPLHPANSSHLLSLTLGPQHADNIYICTVSNAISNNSQTFSPWPRCRTDHSGPWPTCLSDLDGLADACHRTKVADCFHPLKTLEKIERAGVLILKPWCRAQSSLVPVSWWAAEQPTSGARDRRLTRQALLMQFCHIIFQFRGTTLSVGFIFLISSEIGEKYYLLK